MHSSLAVGGLNYAKESVGKGDYPQHHVSRPIINKPVDILSLGGPTTPGQRTNFADQNQYSTRSFQPFHSIQEGGMSRAKQLQSSIRLGTDEFQSTMASTAQKSFVPLQGARRSQLARPPTSNQLQGDHRLVVDQQLPLLDPCPAAALHVDDKSEYRFTREFQNHKFYKPVTMA